VYNPVGVLGHEPGGLWSREFIAFVSNIFRKVIMRAFFPLFIGQNPTSENHAKMRFTIGIPSGLRSAYYIKI
jgi:hypothetical protein